MNDKEWEYNGKYLSVFISRCTLFELSFAICGYFDNRPKITICLFHLCLIFSLPIRNKWTDECDCPKWGLSYHDSMLWIHKGGNGNLNGGSKWWTVRMPWKYEWVRTSYFKKDWTWANNLYNKSIVKAYSDEKEWEDILWIQTHPYKYKLNSGEIQERIADIKVSEMEWRMHWFKWLPLFNKVRRYIDIKFNDEVGERTGSWKGGTIGCSYEIKKHETPHQCLMRMERERKM